MTVNKDHVGFFEMPEIKPRMLIGYGTGNIVDSAGIGNGGRFEKSLVSAGNPFFVSIFPQPSANDHSGNPAEIVICGVVFLIRGAEQKLVIAGNAPGGKTKTCTIIVFPFTGKDPSYMSQTDR